MAKVGRPTLKTTETVETILGLLTEGVPLSKICERDDMPTYLTVWSWQRDDQEFFNASAHAKKQGTHKLADDCLGIMEAPLSEEPEIARIEIMHRKACVDTRMRLIGQWNRSVYGTSVMHSNDPENPLPASVNVNLVRADEKPDNG